MIFPCVKSTNTTNTNTTLSGEEEGGEEDCFVLLPGGGDHCQTNREGGGEILNIEETTNANAKDYT